MTIRMITVNSGAKPCPVCKNKSRFSACSQQVAEDLCEVWLTCQCGFDTPERRRFESVMGGLGDGNIRAAIECWNDAASVGWRDRLRARTVRIRDEALQMIRDIEWWNANRLDAEPFDCGAERVLVKLAGECLDAINRDDRAEMTRLSKAMVDHMTLAVEGDECHE